MWSPKSLTRNPKIVLQLQPILHPIGNYLKLNTIQSSLCTDTEESGIWTLKWHVNVVMWRVSVFYKIAICCSLNAEKRLFAHWNKGNRYNFHKIALIPGVAHFLRLSEKIFLFRHSQEQSISTKNGELISEHRVAAHNNTIISRLGGKYGWSLKAIVCWTGINNHVYYHVYAFICFILVLPFPVIGNATWLRESTGLTCISIKQW